MLVVKNKSISLLWELNYIFMFILLHEKFLQFDWIRAVVIQLNLKHLHVKITKPFASSSFTQIIAWFVRDIWHNNFEISLVVFMPNITTNHAITYTNSSRKIRLFWHPTGPPCHVVANQELLNNVIWRGSKHKQNPWSHFPLTAYLSTAR